MTPTPQRIAVVGSGVAGLTAAYVASRTAHVTLFEADERLGGHADTHVVREGDRELAIDTGFIVHNPRTYPVLLRLFAELGVVTQPSEMSMSIRDDDTGLQWAGALGARGVFPTAANVRNPRYLRLLTEIPRFHRRARRLLASHGADLTLRDFLEQGRFTAYFHRHFMEPLVAAVWSCDPEVALDYPARYLFTFLEHHGMLGVFGSPQWRTVTGGSQRYVAAVAARLQEVRAGVKVTSVVETSDGVEVTDGNGAVQLFDAVVIATHPGQVMAMLAEPTATQRDVLTAMPYSTNTALLHTDTSVLPRSKHAWAAWNFARRTSPEEQVLVTYDLTRLQRLDTETRYLLTLVGQDSGGEAHVDPATVIDRMEYEHPLYNPGSVAAQAQLPSIDTDRISFAGAYHGWGFHEDGARSGLAAVERLGLTWPAVLPRSPADDVPTGTYVTTIRHIRRKPFARTFTHRSHTWVVDLDDLPDHGVLGRFEARDHLGRADVSIRANVDAFLADHGIDLRGASTEVRAERASQGRVVMAAHARAFGHCFNPISVFWCWDASGRHAATVVEVHNTYGDRHAYLVHPDEQGRATTPKAMYVSPFHGTDGTYDLTVPVPHDDRLDLVVNLSTDDGATFHASLSGCRADLSPRQTAPAAIRGSALIRMHGIWLWLRRLPIQPRPTHAQKSPIVTITSARRSANHWPGLDVLPDGPWARIAARVARALFETAVNRLHVTVHVGDKTVGRGGPVMVVSRPDEFFLRLGRDQLIGFGEAYLTGAWDAEDLDGFLAVLAARIQHLIPQPLQKLRALVVRKPPEEELSSTENSRDNIAHHYDLSNELFELFLDPTLSYSSALFPPDQLDGSATARDLELAQVRKIERLLDQAGVTEGSRVLEIGSGWGELAIRAARRGATVRSITLSTEQKVLADERIDAAGQSDRVAVDLCDYRDVEGEYDAVVSVEMIEAVGWQFWPTYFQTLDRVLAPRGRVSIQAITMPHDRMLVTRNTYTWINKYIFPGGFLPSVTAIDEITRRDTGLRLVEGLSMGASYAETLRLWDQAFLAASGRVLDLGFDRTFLRMWHFYLKYSQAGFASGYLDVNQLTFERPT